MAALLGITLPELLGTPPGVLNILPASALRFIRQLSLVPTAAGVADGAVVHSGFAQLPDALVDLGVVKLLIPGLERGLPFRFFNQRAPQAAGEQIEGQSGNWVLQIDCPEVFVPLPFEPGIFVPETTTNPAFLKRFPPPPANPQPPAVPKPDPRLVVDAGVLEITSDGDFRIRPDFSFHPGDTSGDLVRFRVEPPGFFLDDLGAYLPEGVIDLSGETSPSAALAAGFGDDFKGVYLKEVGLFFPRDTPLVGSFLRSVGLRETLIGNAYAGEAVLEFGPDLATAPPVPNFLQVLGNETRALTFDPDTSTVETVTVAESFARVIAVADVNTPWRERRGQARWVAPDGETYTGARTPPLQVRPGDTILYDYVAAEGFEPPPSRTIHVSGVVSPGAAARLQVRHAGHTFDDVTFLAAPPAWLADATLHVTGIPAGLDFNWLVNREFGVPGEREGGEPKPFRFPPLEVKDDQRIGVSAHGHNRFIVLDVLQSGDPIIVSQGHATDELGNPFKVTNPGPVFHLPTALAKGELRQLGDPQATVAEGALVGLRPGRLYQGTFQREERQTTQGEPEVRIVISVFYRRAEASNPVGFATLDDVTGLPIPDYTGFQPSNRIGELLRERLATLQSGTILVVGRTSRTSDTGTDPAKLSKLNRDLQKGRAADASSLVKDALPSGTGGSIPVIARGELDASETDTVKWDLHIGDAVRAAREDTFGSKDEQLHATFQRADIFIRRAAFAAPPPKVEVRKVSHKVLLPGPPDAPNPPVASPPADGRLRRLRLLAKWDREPVPVKLEALMVWELSKLAIPIDEDLNTDPDTTTDTCEGDAEDADFLRFLLRLVWDDRTGQARWTGAVDSAGDKDGLKRFCNTRAFGLLLLAGPMLAADPPIDEADGATLRFIAVGALLPTAFLLTRGDEPVIRNVDVTLNGVSFEVDTQEGPFGDPEAVRFKLDYSVSFEVHETTFGLRSKTDPVTGKVSKMTARFREVGLELRDLGEIESPGDIGFDNFHLLFDPSKGGSIDIVDPGAFDLDGPLGKLLGITAARIGHGSLFFEFDMAFLLDLGVVEVSQATLRISFGEDGPSAELRGLKVGVDIDHVVVGEGELKVLDGGQIKAALDLDIVPTGVKASGRLDLLPQADFTAAGLALEVEYSTGLPLGSTGLGIYGFFGLFGANMARNVDRLAPNRVTAELTWLGQVLRGVGSPFLPQRQAWTFGVGAVIGTLPDSARSFHAKGGLVLELPGPGVIFGIDAAFLKKRRKTKTNDLTGTMTGLALVDPFAYLIGIEVNFKVGKFLTLHVPTSAFFPRAVLPGETKIRPSFVRIGQDGVDPGGGRPPRLGTPARATLTAGSFGNVAEVFAYLMIEEDDLLDLGGVDELDFHGFSIGLGIGVEVRWGTKRVGLDASALLLVGLGTSPLVIAGKFKFEGSLKLLVYSLSVSAEVDFRHDDTGTVFDGLFCGKISFFFFSIKGCVPLHLGDGDPFTVPEPPPLISGISMVDRRGQEIAGADVGQPAGPVTLPAPVWPDAVPVLHFDHEPATALDPAGPFHASLHSLEHSQAVHVGDFTYVFALKNLRLEKRAGGSFTPVPGPLPSAWWFPSWRPAFLDATAAPPSGEEARELGLLTWHPAPWARSLIPDQQQDTLGDIGDSIGNACDDKLLPDPDCALGGEAVPGPDELEWQATSSRSVFRLVLTDPRINDEPAEQAISTLGTLGFHFEAAQVFEWGVDHQFEGRTLRAGLRLARGYQFQQVGKFLRASFCFTSQLRLSRPQRRPELVLAINLDEFRDNQPPGPGIEVFADPNGFPLVRAVRPGEEVDLTGGLAATFETPFGTFMLIRYRFELDDLGVSGWRVMAYRGDVQVMLACGRDARRSSEVEDANQDRLEWVQGLFTYFQTATFSTQQFVLDAGTEYRVLADWSWTGEHRLGGGPTPEQPVTQEFRFTTAPAAGPDQQRTILEQDVFDPRALSGYVLAQPTLDDPPAFLDDPVRVHFSVGHLTELLDRYRRDLQMEVRRTDVPALRVAEGGGAPNLLFEAVFSQKLTDAVDVILADAIFNSDCLGGVEPPLGGAEGEITFDMAPNAGYELRVLAPDRSEPAEPQERSLFVRAPFRSSRYRDPLELFAALGFGPPTDPGALYAADHIFPFEFTPPALPAHPQDDAELRDAFHQLGLDALEAPAGPRTTLLWAPRQDGSFEVVGLLVEGPEPVDRPPRLDVLSAELRSERLDLVRSTRAGDRLLFVPSAPVALPPSSESELDIAYRENGGPELRARRIILAAPVAVLWEA